MTTSARVDIGDPCPKCASSPGYMHVEDIDERCTCNDEAPCKYCIDKPLTCSKCGYVQPPPNEDEPDLPQHYAPMLTENQVLYVSAAVILAQDIAHGDIEEVRASAQHFRFALINVGEVDFRTLQQNFAKLVAAVPERG